MIKNNMMKKIVLAIIMVVSATTTFAQREAGSFTIQPKVGVNGSTFYNLDSELKDNVLAGWVAGAEMEYHLTNWFSLSAGALYSQRGCDAEIKDGFLKGLNQKVKLNYIDVPVLANFYVWKGLALKVGVQPSFKVSDKVEVSDAGKQPLDEEFKNAKNFDLCVPLGVSYDFGGLVLELRGVAGLFNLYGDEDYRSSYGQLTVGYKFALK